MKKIRTKIIALATVLVMFLAIARVAYADAYESTIVFTADDRYFIEVPETIVVGEPAHVKTLEADIATGKKIWVYLGNGDDEAKIYNEKDRSRPLSVHFFSDDGTRATSTTPLAVLDGEGTKEFTTTIGNPEDAMAGEYTGTVMFDVNCW